MAALVGQSSGLDRHMARATLPPLAGAPARRRSACACTCRVCQVAKGTARAAHHGKQERWPHALARQEWGARAVPCIHLEHWDAARSVLPYAPNNSPCLATARAGDGANDAPSALAPSTHGETRCLRASPLAPFPHALPARRAPCPTLTGVGGSPRSWPSKQRGLLLPGPHRRAAQVDNTARRLLSLASSPCSRLPLWLGVEMTEGQPPSLPAHPPRRLHVM